MGQHGDAHTRLFSRLLWTQASVGSPLEMSVGHLVIIGHLYGMNPLL